MKAKEIDNPVIGKGMAKWKGEKLMNVKRKKQLSLRFRRKEQQKKNQNVFVLAAAQIMATCGF